MRDFLFGSIFKKMNQIAVPQFFRLGWKVEGQWFGSVFYFWGWDQIENVFWDYPAFKENEGVFVYTSNSEAIVFDNWAPSQPDDSTGTEYILDSKNLASIL